MERSVDKNKCWKVGSIAIATIFLYFGGMVYLLFRPERLLVFDWLGAVNLLSVVESLRLSNHCMPQWMEYSLPDGLWVFSYYLFVGSIWDFKIKKCWMALIVLPFIAIMDEILQYYGVAVGTFDMIDIVAYTLATLTGFCYLVIVDKSIKNDIIYE